jgi:hypothetical protein
MSKTDGPWMANYGADVSKLDGMGDARVALTGPSRSCPQQR